MAREDYTTREERLRYRLHILTTKGGSLNESEQQYIKYIENELSKVNT